MDLRVAPVRRGLAALLLGSYAAVAALCVSGVLAGSPSPGAAQLLSPGPLSRAHHELEGDDNCIRCHASGRQVPAQRCLGCHDDLASRIRAGQGLHGTTYRGQACAGRCHVEHRGRDARLVRWPAGGMNSFDHRDTGWPLEGAHVAASCRDCHRGANERGNPTFLNASPRCASCHQDVHQGRLGTACQSCHDQTDFERANRAAFSHAQTRFPLRGGHTSVACAACHGTPPEWLGIEFSTCASCHQDPHEGRLGAQCVSCHNEFSWADTTRGFAHPGLSLGGGHRGVACASCHDQGNTEAPSGGARCVSCHRPVHEAPLGNRCETCHRSIEWLGLPRRVGLEAHPLTAFPLVAQHADVACAECHELSMPRPERYRGLEFDQCADCHADVHAGEFAGRAQADCASCHTPHGFHPTTFGVAAHASTDFPLTGLHTAVPCAGCHGAERPRHDLRVPEQACASCHENPHGNQFRREMAQGGCASCHQTTGWSSATGARVPHTTWPLTGAHAQAACEGCHAPSAAERAAGVTQPRYRGVPRDCEGCHEDTHAGQFRSSEPLRGCADCHETTAFTLPDWDHAAMTTFPIDGRHQDVSCAGCHASVTLRNGASSVRYRLGYRECRDCHADPHATPEAPAPRDVSAETLGVCPMGGDSGAVTQASGGTPTLAELAEWVWP
ncbi:MAG: hypothetical protein IPI43_04405 [Sandaracinaceae bacterium]|nr:hypothetical protein [Sandaracinaceae bacterium]